MGLVLDSYEHKGKAVELVQIAPDPGGYDVTLYAVRLKNNKSTMNIEFSLFSEALKAFDLCKFIA